MRKEVPLASRSAIHTSRHINNSSSQENVPFVSLILYDFDSFLRLQVSDIFEPDAIEPFAQASERQFHCIESTAL